MLAVFKTMRIMKSLEILPGQLKVLRTRLGVDWNPTILRCSYLIGSKLTDSARCFVQVIHSPPSLRVQRGSDSVSIPPKRWLVG